ncbi:uncharacterized protein LOC114521050 [Dendronephthya gigantea]|uniref:uncharacterized protein LOC114521050 n=1 Tax=Dendronephthya gigantea TaxID=151771 RepID=UPI00106CF583|nr:uncharacterized protein LOC114521050 [Dendronephthya gigantea]
MAGLRLLTGFCLLTFLQMKNHISRGAYPDCNFTNGFGGWINQEMRDWVIVNSTKTDLGILTGRQGVGDSFAVTGDHSRWFEMAKLYSPNITGPVCMKFYFYLYQTNNGFLKIRTVRAGSTYEQTVFSRYGNHSDKWNLAQIYLSFSPTDVYKVVISGKSDYGSSKRIAIDDIIFQNHTCDELTKANIDFNCTFEAGTCGWDLMNGLSISFFDRDLNQSVVALYQATLSSPQIFERDSCFTFQYYVAKYDTIFTNGGIFVFIKDANNRQMLPVWSKRVYYDRGKWHTIQIRLRHQDGFDQVEIQSVSFFVHLANFYIMSEVYCNDFDDQKTFFVSIKNEQPLEYVISEDGVSCDNYPASDFIASTIPSKDYPQPMYLFGSGWEWRQTTLRQSRAALGDDLYGYFYVSLTPREDSSAIYFKIENGWYGQYISELRPTPLDGNWTGSVVYVKDHQSRRDNGNCPPGYLSLGKTDKCFWLMCDYSSNVESSCSEKLGTLASLDTVSIRRGSEYLKYIKAASVEIKQVTVGLTKYGDGWIWKDGRVYNDSDGLLSTDYNTKVYFSWEDKNGEWVLKSGQPDGVRLHLCEKIGKNIAHKSGSNQSSTFSRFSSGFAVDGLLSTYSSTRLPEKSSPKSWWKVELGNKMKIFFVQITWNAEPTIGIITVSLERDDILPNFVKKVEIGWRISFTCEPPLPARYLRIERKNEALKISEVDVIATDSILNDIRGVRSSSWENQQEKLINDPRFNLASSFKVWTQWDEQKVLEAYLLDHTDGREGLVLI